MRARGRGLWRWFFLRFGLPFVLPASAAVAMVWGLHDVFVQVSPDPASVPDWFALFSSAKVLLVGLLIGVGAMRDMWIARKNESGYHYGTVMGACVSLWGYALLMFATFVVREMCHLDTYGTVPFLPGVLTALLVIVAGTARWLRLSTHVNE